MWNSEEVEKMKKFIKIATSGARINGTEITELYNKIFNKNLKPTNCGSCISTRYKELKHSFELFQKQLEEQEKLAVLEAIDELMTEPDEIKITTKRGRIKKKE